MKAKKNQRSTQPERRPHRDNKIHAYENVVISDHDWKISASLRAVKDNRNNHQLEQE